MRAHNFQVQLWGNVTRDPSLHRSAKTPRVTFTVAVDPPSRWDEARGVWVHDGGNIFQRCVAFGQLAENIAETLRRGDPVIVCGALRDNSRTVTEGDKENVRRDTEVLAEHVGPDLRRSSTTVTRNPSRNTSARPSTANEVPTNPAARDTTGPNPLDI